MSTLRTFNLQNPDSGTVNIEMDQGGNTLMTGIATVRGAAHFTSTSGSDAVGIGTDITAYKLDVRVTGAEAGLRVYNPDTSSNASGILRLGNDDNQNAAFLRLNGSNNTSAVGGAGSLVLGHGLSKDLHLSTAGVSRLRITSGGNVSIGSLTDDSIGSTTTLTIDRSSGNGQISFAANGTVRGRIFADNSTSDFRIGNPTSNDLMLYTNNLERLRIRSDGDVIIGTNDLESQLGSRRRLAVCDTTNGALLHLRGQSPAIFFDQSGGNIGKIYLDSVDLAIYSDTPNSEGTERLRINSAGNIGMSNDMTGAGGVYARLTIQMPTQSGGSGIQVANSSNGSGDGSTSNIVLRSVNNDCSQWADAEYRASQHIFAIQGTERMRINANGYVTKPNQPRFFARRSANYTGYDGRNVGGTWIAFDVLDYNVGGGFQTSGSDQGRFVAPVSGLYLFHAATYKNTGTADWSQSWFDIDGSRANGTDFVHSSSTRFAQNAVQVYLTAGQKIGFHPYNNATNNPIIQTATHTWFKGCLLG